MTAQTKRTGQPAHCLPWPAPVRDAVPILPVFLPFAGCPQRCIFCAQHIQSNTPPQTVPYILTRLRHTLHERQTPVDKDSPPLPPLPPVELAFYGGTFTALPVRERAACLALTREAIDTGLALRARCSTRPDAVDMPTLKALRTAGFTTVELGVQSFYNPALYAAQRGYDADTALRACALVREAGLTLGVQLLPGMPEHSPDFFIQDVRTALDAGAQLLRFYPCQVIEGTPLEDAWRAGAFCPWTLAQTVDALAEGWLLAHRAGVPIIRMGLAPEEALAAYTLAGPRHPALGALVQGEALYRAVKCALTCAVTGTYTPVKALHAPRWTQGYFWGHKGALRTVWAALGLTPATVTWHTLPELHIYYRRRPLCP